MPNTLHQKSSNDICPGYALRLSSCSGDSRPSKHLTGLPSRVQEAARAIQPPPEPVSVVADCVRVPPDFRYQEEHSHITAALCHHTTATAPRGCDTPVVQHTPPPSGHDCHDWWTQGCEYISVSIDYPRDPSGSRLGDAHGATSSRRTLSVLNPGSAAPTFRDTTRGSLPWLIHNNPPRRG